MRIFGGNEFSAKPDVGGAKSKGPAASAVRRTPAARPVEEVAKGGTEVKSEVATQRSDAVGAKAVVLSQTAARVNEVSSEQQAERSARLQEVQQMLDAGEYQVDFDRLADGVLSEEIARAKP